MDHHCGVVGGIEASVLERVPRPTLYLPFTQSPSRGMDIAMRITGNPMALVPEVKATIATLDVAQPVTDIMPLEKMRQNEIIGVTYAAALMSIFGVIALLLSCVGIYGTTAYLVAARKHEIEIRVAQAASAPNVIRLVFGRSARAAIYDVHRSIRVRSGSRGCWHRLSGVSSPPIPPCSSQHR